MRLLAIGLGYCARWYIATRGLRSLALGTTRRRDGALHLENRGFRAAYCDGGDCDPAVRQAFAASDALLISAPPGQGGDPILAAFESELRAAPSLRRIVYLSTIGVYGDHQGAWIDETAPMHPSNERSQLRIEAENAWRKIAADIGARLFILRLAGIYGPGRSALDSVRNGTARRIVKPGQVFNRIHVEDAARAIEAALATSNAGGAWSVADDEPSSASDPIEWAAGLLGVPPPPEIRFEDAQMSPMALSFWSENRRVSNARLKSDLGVALAYRSYREGLTAILAGGEAP